MELHEYLIYNCVKNAKSFNFPQPATHQRVVNFLHGDKLWDALDEYLKAHIHCVEDLDRPLD